MGCGSSVALEKRLNERALTRGALSAFGAVKSAASNAASTVGQALSPGMLRRSDTVILDGKTGTFKRRSEEQLGESVQRDATRLAEDAKATAKIVDDFGRYCDLVRGVRLFSEMGVSEVEMLARSLRAQHFRAGEMIYNEGDHGHECWIVESGEVMAWQTIWSAAYANVKEWREMRAYRPGQCFGERGLVRSEPRQARMVARTASRLLKVTADTYVACVRACEQKEDLLRKVALFSTMTDAQLGKVVSLLTRTTFGDGDVLLQKGEACTSVLIIESGEASGEAVGEAAGSKRYRAGEAVGASALLEGGACDATIRAVGEVAAYHLSREQFEARLGQMATLQAQQFAADPRKLLSDFYREGDVRGPAGVLAAKGAARRQEKNNDDGSQEGDGRAEQEQLRTRWFAVYRPCSRDSICKMIGHTGVGKARTALHATRHATQHATWHVT